MKSIIKFFLESSENPDKLSLTLQGLMASVASIVSLIVSFHGGTPISLDTQSIVVQNATITISAVGTAIGGITVLFGLFRKFFNWFKPWSTPKV